MKVFIFATLMTVCACARLDNTYLPPPGASQSGGGPGLAAPGFGSNRPHGGGGAPGGRPGAPGGRPGGGGFGGGPAGAAPSGPQEPPIAIISYENENNGDGSYRYSYETANGIKVEEEGEIKNKGSENEILSVRGSYSYTAPDGTPITVTYIADENGFQPQGDHLPTPPPAPQGSAPGGAGGYPSGPAGGGGYPSGPAGGQGYPSGGGGYPSGGAPQRPSNQYIPPSNQPSRPSGNGAFSPTNEKILSVALTLTCVTGAPQAPSQGATTEPIPILRQEQEVNFDGTYKYAYETGNGIAAEETGFLKNAGTEQEAQVAQGEYSYTAPDGTLIRVTYIADENGFQPQGDHIPTPPPIPPAIQRALEYLASLPATEAPQRL
ncbi:pupal cuticle protein 36a-like [Phlebotomus papatasi]|uniref:pupal cuticle protein 36a-like n=1 Tax=Phlebotomus papatasi TaxID=29031 RepID=UPI0024836319|nr:pupal cuticle protein 36a-like [Phlebotomus papatasi]